LRSRSGFVAFFFPGSGDDLIKAWPGAYYGILDLTHARRRSVVDLRSGTVDGPGQDTLIGINTVYGSRYDDVLRGDRHTNRLYGYAGDDVVAARGGRDDAIGGPGNDQLDGGPGRDYLLGEEGRDILRGRTGNDDLIEVRPGANVLLAGPGRDRCYGSYRVPPSIERSCELHNPVPHRASRQLSRSPRLQRYTR
jgi:Ca2+-binding RTX toxin-like protein